ncbi:MAG: hypothetical protein BWY76_02106 [bacterium ADurb.Bin429]|nr:MAG: hypothetical protein BWY76_02106 [bacterium ADurb.Bin429]
MGVVSFTGADGTRVATLLHYTCHPIFGYPHRYIIGDWPGAWAELARAEGGVPLVINGCCGNIAPLDHQNPDHINGVPGGHRGMAEKLMETTTVIQKRLEATSAAPLGWARTRLRLPLRRLTPEAVADARRLLDEHPTPMFLDEERTRVDWDWVYAVGVLDLHAREMRDPTFAYEIQAFRIGDVALVTLMGEPFVEAQLSIKLESPARYTLVAHFCNGYAGYIPTARAFERGGYETRTSNGSKFEPDALERIADTALELLNGLFAEV